MNAVMQKVKALVSDPKSSKPRAGPTVVTEIDLNNIAFVELLQWVSTDATGHRFEHITTDLMKAPGAVDVLAIWLVRPEDSAGISKKFTPYNVLFVTEGVDDFLQFQTVQYKLGQNWGKLTIHREVLTPPSFNAPPLTLDGKRIKLMRGNGDVWVNLKAVTDLLLPTANEQGLVFRNYHPLPLPTLEYRIFTDPLPAEAQRRAAAFADGIKPVTFNAVTPAYVNGEWGPGLVRNQDGSLGYLRENSDFRRFTLTTDALNIEYAWYMYIDTAGKVHRARIGDVLPTGAIPYVQVLIWETIEIQNAQGKQIPANHFFILVESDQHLEQIVNTFYGDDVWHTYAEDQESYANDENGDPIYRLGDMWTDTTIDDITIALYYPHQTNGHNAYWQVGYDNHFGGKLTVYIADRDPLITKLLMYRLRLAANHSAQH